MDSTEMRQDIVDRGIEKGENGMRPVLESLYTRQSGEATAENPSVGRAGAHNSGKMASDAPDQTGTTPFNPAQGEDLPERAGISRGEDAARERKVDPEAVRESFKEAELDPAAETEPEEGETAA